LEEQALNAEYIMDIRYFLSTMLCTNFIAQNHPVAIFRPRLHVEIHQQYKQPSG